MSTFSAIAETTLSSRARSTSTTAGIERPPNSTVKMVSGSNRDPPRARSIEAG